MQEGDVTRTDVETLKLPGEAGNVHFGISQRPSRCWVPPDVTGVGLGGLTPLGIVALSAGQPRGSSYGIGAKMIMFN